MQLFLYLKNFQNFFKILDLFIRKSHNCNKIPCACVQYLHEFAFETTTAIDSFKILGIDDSRSKIIFTPSQNHLAICGSIDVVLKIFGILPICNSSLISLYNVKFWDLFHHPLLQMAYVIKI